MSDTFDDYMPANQFENDESLSAGALAGLSEYEALEVTKSNLVIKKQATNLINELLKVYFDAHMITEDSYIASVKSIETSSLASLLNQAKYAEHAVTTLMRKIDAGMHAELGVYEMLIKLQDNAIKITMQVSQYARNCAPYFKALKDEMEATNTIDVVSIQEDDTLIDDHGNSYENTDGRNFRGTKDLNEELLLLADNPEALKEKYGIDIEDLEIELQVFGDEGMRNMPTDVSDAEIIEDSKSEEE